MRRIGVMINYYDGKSMKLTWTTCSKQHEVANQIVSDHPGAYILSAWEEVEPVDCYVLATEFVFANEVAF